MIDRWFLSRLKNIFNLKNELEKVNSLESLSDELLRKAKIMGFSDFQITRHIFKSGLKNTSEKSLEVRDRRKKAGIIPYVKQIDTLAAEYPALTNYLYLTYSGSEHDVEFVT